MSQELLQSLLKSTVILADGAGLKSEHNLLGS
jgi:hypothetical protein